MNVADIVCIRISTERRYAEVGEEECVFLVEEMVLTDARWVGRGR